MPEYSSIHYLLTQFRVIVTYIRLVFLPFNQNLDYDYPVFKNFFELSVLISFLFLMTILLCANRLFSKYRLVSFSILWFFLALLPESSFFAIKDVIFEHRLYLPLAGVSLFLVSGAYYLIGKNGLKAMVVVLTMVLACYSVLTYQRNKVWKDPLTLWDDTVHKSPHKARGYGNRGMAYYKQGDFTHALSDFNKAIELNPNYTESYNNRGMSICPKVILHKPCSILIKPLQ
jgi:tetratricopeptide (TPR) repeat protein